MKAEINYKKNNWLDTLTNALRVGMTKSTIILSNEVISRAPVDTGELKNNNYRDVEETKYSIDGIVYNTKEYAPHVEFGTKYQKAQSFMRTSLIDSADKILKTMREEIRKAL
jgi:HK97 gp10 family phage protein